MGSSSEAMRPENVQPVLVRELAERFGMRLLASPAADVTVTGVAMDSRRVLRGDLYAAIPGARRHGAEFADAVARKGAAAIMTDEKGLELVRAAGVELPVLVTASHPREILGDVAAAVYGTAGSGVRFFGVTGTNGKTSVVYLLTALLEAAGMKAGLSSTAERRVGDEVVVSDLTSPEAPELHAIIARMREKGAEAITVEVSAHATWQGRVAGLMFDVVGFNNFSQDHLDDFGSMEEYFRAKTMLFQPTAAKRGVVVVDSPAGQRMVREAKIPVTRLATEYGQEADWHMAVTRQNLDGVSFVLQGPAGAHVRATVPLFGRFMAENAALALIMLHEAGISLAQVSAGLEKGVIPLHIPGRLECLNPGLPLSAGPRFYLDYGHTPGAFQAMLDALGEVAPGRVIFMFGADGDRDTTKREEMGRIAAKGSDALIVCDYHPRSEPPAKIRAQLLAGAAQVPGAEVYEVPDPKQAIRKALALAGPGDVILYAGPGHEDYMEVAGEYLPYSARDEVRKALSEAGLLS